ncbi:hypothetical protein ACB092_12G096700 [Castanea dentata]
MSGSKAGPSSAPSSTQKDEVETIYSCVVGIPSKTDERKLTSLRSWYQIPDELNPRLAVRDEWCCQPHFGIGVYEAYLLGGLRLPLNAFARELLTWLGIGLCQLNPNAWRLIVSMQVLWREVFEGDCPLTVDEFLFCYKPSEITRRKDCRIIKSLVTSDRNWKTKFFFVSGFWAGRPVDVSRDSFPPYTGELGNLRPEDMLTTAVFYLGRVQKARLHPERDFHTLVTLQRLATWGLGPEPSPEALSHEITIRRRMATMKENKGKGAMSKFIAASRQATELDRTRLLLERRIKEVKDECKGWAETAAEAKDAAKGLLNLVEELKADIVEKDSRLDHFQGKIDELSNSLVRAKDEAVEEFRASKQFTDLLDANYAAGFEDFRMEAKEKFPEVDFSPIVLQLGGASSSFLQTSSEDVNVEDDASTKPAQDDPDA